MEFGNHFNLMWKQQSPECGRADTIGQNLVLRQGSASKFENQYAG